MTLTRTPFVLLLVTLSLLLLAASDAVAQRIDGEDFLSPDRLQAEWHRLQRAPEGKRLLGETKRRGLRFAEPGESGWGWTASVISETAGREAVLFCLFEAIARDGRPGGVLLRLRRGSRENITLILSAPGGVLDDAEEWEIDRKGRLTRTKGWSSRLTRVMQQWCGTACTGALGPCGAEGKGAGPDAGLKAWLSCATSICGSCMLVSMLVSGQR